jgi:uracil-DNA glycosylase family 4
MGLLTGAEWCFNTSQRMSSCDKCGLDKQCISPHMRPTGEGKQKTLIVAESPGKEEDQQGIQLIGKAGQRLRSVMDDLGWDLDQDCWKSNCVICRPKDNKMQDKYIECCRPTLLRTVEELNPEVIILLGASAVKSFLGQYWEKDIGSIGRWVGWKIPLQPTNTWICPTYHPSYLERTRDPALEGWFRRHLEAAFELEGRPWKNVPDAASEVEVIKSPDEAADWLMERAGWSDAFSFDYETNMLKPDHPDARIVACSVCWGGKWTIAFPWEGEAIKAMGELLRSEVPKYSHNLKFEERWTRRILGHGVKNWAWDGMQAAHVLDGRTGITSLKFQAFVQFGLPLWNKTVEPYLEADGGNQKNRIHKCDLRELLLYCGIDSLVEFRLAKKQMKEMAK